MTTRQNLITTTSVRIDAEREMGSDPATTDVLAEVAAEQGFEFNMSDRAWRQLLRAVEADCIIRRPA